MAQPLHILLADDSPDTRRLLQRVLHDAFPGFVVTEADLTDTLRVVLADAAHNLADLDTFMQTMPIAVLVSDDPACTVITGNQAASRLLRTSFRTNLSKTAPAVELPVNHQVIRNGRLLAADELPMQMVGRTGVPLYDDELEIRFDDGEVKYIAGYVSPRLDNARQVRGVIAAYVDLTERRRLDTLQRLFAQLSADLVSPLDYAERLRRITQLTVPDLADYSMLDVVEPDGQIVRAAIAHREPIHLNQAAHDLRDPPNPQRDTSVSQVLRTGTPQLIADVPPDLVSAVAHDEHHLAILRAACPRSTVILPLVACGLTIGALTLVVAGSGRRYTEADLPALQELAARVALAIDHAHLYELEQRTRRIAEEALSRLTRLQAVTASLGGAVCQDDVARIFVEQAIPATGAVGGGVVVISEDGKDFILLNANAFSSDELAAWQRYPIDRGTPAGEIVRTGAPLIFTSAETWERYFAAAAPLARARGYQSYAGFPLTHEGRTIGVISFCFSDRHTLTTNDQAFMQALAQQCAQALERVRLYEAEQVARAEAQEAVDLRDAFFSVASHELRSPLTNLLGHAQLLQRRVTREGSLGDRDQRALGIVVSQAQRLSQQIADLLDVARLAQGQLSVRPAPMDLCALARRVAEGVQPTLNHHTVVCEDEGAPLFVLGDATRLEQVVQNLVQNAIKYSPGGGPVKVRVQRASAQVELMVEDQGIGIPAEALPRLFQRFYRADQARTRGISGMGIGLYVVQEIVNLHGGTVTVESEVGQGSRFFVRLPHLDALPSPHEPSQ